MATTSARSEGPVTPRGVRAFVRTHLPRLGGRDIRFLSLSDFSTWEIDGRYILRFARNAESNRQLARELTALPILEAHLAVEVPRIDLVVTYRRDLQVMGYPKVPGVDGESIRPPPQLRAPLVEQFAGLLGALRALPATAVHPETPKWAGHDLERARRHLVKHGHLIAERAPELIVPEVVPYLRGEVSTEAPPPADPVVSHCDIKGEHLLFDPARGRLTGVIDWADMCLTHPAIDLGALAIWLGPRFVHDVGAMLGMTPEVMDRALTGVRMTMLAGLARTFAGEKRWPVDLATTMIRWAFATESARSSRL